MKKRPSLSAVGRPRIPGHRTRGMKGVVPLGVKIDRAARRADSLSQKGDFTAARKKRGDVISLLKESRNTLAARMRQLNALHHDAVSPKRRRELMKQIRKTNTLLRELDRQLE